MIFIVDTWNAFLSNSFLGNAVLTVVYSPSCLLKPSSAFLVYIIPLISSRYVKNVDRLF
ncbi:hypothetical protein [Clostridioides sp. ES-S-0010-02]|uniref:hypothetical protein n=1 Tax=Clostridioides sp. ES-S-0010-02 TaxID=2770776 RepID=UPI0039BD2A0A|nr:hypothetical protein JJC01_03870 [Clostridioides sp. ES-S-0010-02]